MTLALNVLCRALFAPETGQKRPLVGAIMKREEAYILEWVAWYRLHGFDVMIADNCTDGPQTKLLRQLAALGEIHYVDVRDQTYDQQAFAYRQIVYRAVEMGYEILGFLDADEFFEPLNDLRFSGAAFVTETLKDKSLHAIAYRWATFGHDGQVEQTDALVLERFTRHGPSDHRTNQHVKSFGRLKPLLWENLFKINRIISNPHTFKLKARHYLSDGVRGKKQEMDQTPAAYTDAWVRHYAIKSHAEFSQKRLKGRAVVKENVTPKDAAYLRDYDLNDLPAPLDETVLRTLHAAILRLKDRLKDQAEA